MDTFEQYERITLASACALAGAEGADFAIYLPARTHGDPVLYRHEATGLAYPDFDRMRSQGVTELLVRSRDLSRCQELIEQKLTDVLMNADVTAGEKAAVAGAVGHSLSKDLLEHPKSEENLGRAASFVDGVMDGLMHDPALSGYVLQMAEHERTTASHMVIVSMLAMLLGMEIYGKDAPVIRDLGMAGLLHDVGKIGIHPRILNKTKPLSADEARILQQHPIESARLVGHDPHVSAEACRYIIQHHERVDGKGYPVQMQGTELKVGSRILAIVDSFHAMIGTRVYRLGKTAVEATRALERQAGRQFDPELVAAWVELFARERAEQAPPPQLQCAPTIDTEFSAHPDHRNLNKAVTRVTTRSTRFQCRGRVTVRCVYAGRIDGASDALNEFVAPVNDLSRSGFCMFTPHPMFRGEVVHARIQFDQEPIWVRGTVMWSRQDSAHIFKTGVRMLERIRPEDAEEMVPVKRLSELAVLDRRLSVEARSNGKQASQTASKTPGAMKRLNAMSESNGLPESELNAALTLAMSGDRLVRVRALEVLENAGGRRSAEVVMQLLEDPEPMVRRRALDAVAVMELCDAVERVRKCVDDADAAVSATAVYVLERLQDSKVAV